MEAYTDFAKLYDEFMEDTPYDQWCTFICDVLKKHEINDGLILDLGCGTGAMTRRLRDAGYDMIGVDISEDMLGIAKMAETTEDILYLCQDMREFELYGTVRGIISVCDSLNYILDQDELKHVFDLTHNYLDENGLLLFDFNTTYKYENVIGDTTIAENREDSSFIWENFYDSKTQLNEYDLTFFTREGNLFRRFTETHVQRGYTVKVMKQLVESAGFVVEQTIDADTYSTVRKESERIYIVARRI